MTKEEAAQQIAKLADDGFQATLEVFQNIGIETIQEFGDIGMLRRYGSTTCVFETLLKIVRAFERMNSRAEVENEFMAEKLIEGVYPAVPMVKEGKVVTGPEYSFAGGKVQIIGEKVQRTFSPPNTALRNLAQLAKKYRIVSILAKQFEAGIDVYDQLYKSAYELQNQYDQTKTSAQTYQKEFKPLRERNHLEDILPKLAAIEREQKEEKTKIRSKGDTTVLMRP